MWPVQEAMTDGRTDGRTPQVYRPQSEGLGPKKGKQSLVTLLCNDNCLGIPDANVTTCRILIPFMYNEQMHIIEIISFKQIIHLIK